MRKLSTLVFLLLILMYLGAHSSCYQRGADTSPTAVMEQIVESG